MNKFLRTVNTSPRFYDNEQEKNQWIAKMRVLEKDKISQLFPTNKRIESLRKLAAHLKSNNLISTSSINDVPKGFNQKLPLDKVTHILGQHMLKRSSTIKAQK